MKRLLIIPFTAVTLLVACPEPEPTTYRATLNGAQEVPPVTTSGSGSATATLENSTTLVLNGSYSGLSGPATAAHIHGPADAGATAGVVCNLTRADDAGTGTITGNCPNFDVTGLDAGKYYVNIHTGANPAGEIRGQLQ